MLRATAACNFSCLIWPDGYAAALASLLLERPELQSVGKTQCFATFLPFRTPSPSFFWLFLFFDFLSSSCLFSVSSTSAFPSVHIVGSLTSKLSLTNETGRFEDYDYGLSWQCPQVWSHIPNGSKLDQVARSCSQVGPKLEPTGSKLGWSCGLAGQDCSQVGPMLRPCRIESAFGWCWALQHLPVPCTFLAACPGRTWPPQRCGWVLIEYLVQCEADEGVRRRLNQRGQFFFPNLIERSAWCYLERFEVSHRCVVLRLWKEENWTHARRGWSLLWKIHQTKVGSICFRDTFICFELLVQLRKRGFFSPDSSTFSCSSTSMFWDHNHLDFFHVWLQTWHLSVIGDKQFVGTIGTWQ